MRLSFLAFLSFVGSVLAADSYRLPPGTTQYVHAYGLCAEVTNNFSVDLFVSTKTEKEWKTALTAATSSVAITRYGCSCKSLLAMGNILTGTYSVDPDGAGPLASYQVYCDMDTDGGGWTLAGRTAAGASGASFGWTVSTGSVSNDSAPYSLGIIPSVIDVTEILYGDYTTGKTWGAFVYKKIIPSDFFTTYWNAPINNGYPIPLSGAYADFGMGATIGYAYHTDIFYFRDIYEDSSLYGLRPEGWFTAYGGNHGGNINGSQGMLMIR